MIGMSKLKFIVQPSNMFRLYMCCTKAGKSCVGAGHITLSMTATSLEEISPFSFWPTAE